MPALTLLSPFAGLLDRLMARLAPAAALLLGLSVAGCGINNVPTYEEHAKAAWSEVQNQYQRRADLIPNLVETVKGYAKQEKDVLEGVVEARAKATQVTRRSLDRHRSREVQAVPGRAAAAVRRARPAAGDHRELSGPEVEPELPGAAIAARGHREPHRRRAPRLYRRGAGSTTPSCAPFPAAGSPRSSIRAPSRWRRSRRRRAATRRPR